MAHAACPRSPYRPVRTAAAAITPDWRWRRDSTPYAGGDPINYMKFAPATYEVTIPAGLVAPGVQHLVLRSTSGFKLWYVLITPK